MVSLTTRLDLLEANQMINGNMDLAQRRITATFNNGQNGYVIDRFQVFNGMGVTSQITYSQSSSVPTLAASGFASQNSLLVTVNSAGSISAAGYMLIKYAVEGYDYQRLAGNAGRISFMARSSVPGIYYVSLNQTAGNRSYVAPFTINNANVFEQKFIDVVFDSVTSGYTFDNSSSLQILWTMDTGTNNVTGSLNQWVNGSFYGGPAQTHLGANAGATFQIAQVSLVMQNFVIGGSPSLISVPFSRFGRTIGQEIAACQRYFEKSFEINTVPANGPNGTSFSTLAGISSWVCFGNQTQTLLLDNSYKWKVEKRGAPAFVVFGNSSGFPYNATSTSGSEGWSASALNHIQTDTTGFHSDQEVTAGPIFVALHWTADAEI